MEIFERKSLLELRKLSIQELEKYYMELRRYNYENGVPLKGIEIRKKIHKLLLSLIKIDRKLCKETIEVIKDERIETNKPIIYACTHIGGNDIQRTFEAIKDHAYLFLGDPRSLYKDVAGLMLYLNGVICLETNNKTDRFIAKNRAVELLKNGGDLLIYPEGSWNITDNLPCMKLYTGTVKMALETGAEIIPMAIEQYGKKFYVNIGKNMVLNKSLSVDELNDNLRDTLATLKWDIWESQGIFERTSINQSFVDKFKQDIVDKCEFGFTIDDVYKTMYKDPKITTYEEAFSFTKRIVLNKK